jgi:uncharacterized protein YndB with AHSA1/START domain
MSTTVGETTVSTSTVVAASPERAFSVFTDGIGTWWDPSHHILEGELAEMVFEPSVGGWVYDRGVDGSECRWGQVIVYEPPRHVAFLWLINTSWQLETDPTKASEVHVTFEAHGDGRTLVTLEHRHLDRHGEGWEAMREAVRSGWRLTRFAEVAAASAAS